MKPLVSLKSSDELGYPASVTIDLEAFVENRNIFDVLLRSLKSPAYVTLE